MMKRSQNNDWLDEAIAKAIENNDPGPDFEQWKTAHPAALEALRASARKTEPLNFWRMIIKNRMTKLAVAAAIIVLVGIGVRYLDGSSGFVKPAYAIEQTLQAMAKIRTVHMVGTTPADERYELWMKVNPETGEADYLYYHCPAIGFTHVSTPKYSFQYHQADNITVMSKQRIMETSLRWNDFIKGIIDETLKHKGEIAFQHEHSEALGKEAIVLYLKVDKPAENLHQKARFWIDPDTKLPFKASNESTRTTEGCKTIDEIRYDQPLPKGIFEIPPGATVVDQSILDDPRLGMAVGQLSDDEAAIKICREYWTALIEGNWAQAYTFRPLIGERDYEKQAAANPPREIVSIDTPYRQQGCSAGPIIPCTIRYRDGQIQVSKMVVYFRRSPGKASCIIFGTWGK